MQFLHPSLTGRIYILQHLLTTYAVLAPVNGNRSSTVTAFAALQ